MADHQEMGDCERAENLARRLHANQVDKAGRPYVEHLERVVAILKGWNASNREIVVGWLHDVVEDCPGVDYQMICNSFGGAVAWDVEVLTRDKAHPYASYIDNVASEGSMPARTVKLADLIDHIEQPGCPDSLRPRYRAAILRLMGYPLRKERRA